jgi:hypothetical protein
MTGRITMLAALASLLALPAAADVGFGKLSGTVVDLSGVPQMGATISIAAESARETFTLQLLSNERGRFSTESLLPGLYSIRVTLAGFLPTVSRHIRVDANLTTLLRIELGSFTSSIEQLRRKPNQPSEPDDWAWVLRTSAATRTVLRFEEGEVTLGYERPRAVAEGGSRPHARVEVTSGTLRPGSVSNIADAPSSAIAYEQALGRHGRMLFAGQMSYERSAAAGFVSMWLPSGQMGAGPETSLVLRQSKLGPSGVTFRGARLAHRRGFTLGDTLSVEYGAEYVLVGLGSSTSSLRPGAKLTYTLGPEWRASLVLGSRPWANAGPPGNPLQAALEELDVFPTVLVRNARPVLEGGWHQEFALERRLGAQASVVAGVFRDASRHVALFGRGALNEPDVFQDFYSHAFAYDGGATDALGSRVAYRQKISEWSEVVVMYALAAALSPGALTEALTLRDALDTQHRHSLAARVSTRLPRYGTQMAASYKWISGPVASRMDPYGEVAYQMDPYLNLSVRQALPRLFSAARIEALADFRNLLAQGYVPVSTAEGQVVLIPAFRSFRGGFSVQF